MLLFVDKLQPADLGGNTHDLLKLRFALAKFNLNVDEIIEKKVTEIHTGMFHAGRYVAIFQFNKEFNKGNLAFINHEVSIDKHFDLFADLLTPNIIAGFYKLQQKIKLKNSDQLNAVTLTDEPIFFNTISKN